MPWIFYVIVFFSRLLFINSGNVFFDSKEYISRWSDPNFLHALASGHTPLHSGYVATFWPIYQLAQALGLNPSYVVLLFQSILATLTVFFFYKSLRNLFDREIAYKSALLFSVLPLFWIVNEAVMMETTYLFYWVMSLYFLTKFFLASKNSLKWLSFSGLLWVAAFLTHTVVIMWTPLYFFLVWTKCKKKFWEFFVAGSLTLIIASLLNSWLLAVANNTNLIDGLNLLYVSKFDEHAQLGSILISVLRYFRNWLVPLGYNNSWSLLVFALVGFVISIKKNNWLFVLALFWLVPTFITNQWWDSLLYGRHALIGSLMLAILCASYLGRKALFLLAGLVMIISLSSLSLLKKPIPYLEVSKVLNFLPPGGLVIDSHFARPQTDGEYFGQMIFVDEPGFDMKKLPDSIDNYLKVGKSVYITGQALSEPYGLFCGPYLHNLSLSYKNKQILSELPQKYSFNKLTEIDSANNLDIYKIATGSSKYPEMNKLNYSRRRIDWLDPFRILLSYL